MIAMTVRLITATPPTTPPTMGPTGVGLEDCVGVGVVEDVVVVVDVLVGGGVMPGPYCVPMLVP